MDNYLFRDHEHPLAKALSRLIQQHLLLLLPAWLSVPTCRQLMNILQTCPEKTAESLNLTSAPFQTPAETIRRSRMLEVPKDLEKDVMDSLYPAAERIQQHFGLLPTRHEFPQFLKYLPGDFFKLHRDWGEAPIYQMRRISLVLFLNGQDPASSGSPGLPGYTGGNLALMVHARKDPEDWQWIPIPPAPGLLVAFDSRLLHEVTPVLSGERYTVVTWLTD